MSCDDTLAEQRGRDNRARRIGRRPHRSTEVSSDGFSLCFFV